jgi:hypothetical protein
MAYNETYSSEDVPAIVIDGLGKFGIQLVAFAGLIALVGLYVWGRKAMKK